MPGKISSRRRREVIGSRARRLVLAACLACGLLLSLTAAAGAATFSNPAPITIPSVGTATPYPSPIAVSGLVGTTTNVKVTLNRFSHTFPGDVAIALVPPQTNGPQGTNVLLMNNAGGATSASNANITFDDAAASFLPRTGGVSGSFKPTNNSTNLPSFAAPGPGTSFCNPGPSVAGTPCTNPALAGALNGFNPNGTWSLYVIDKFNGDAGEITGGWTLDITADGGAQPQRTLSVGKTGTGSGTVTSDSATPGINCGGDCAQVYADGTSVTLTAAPTPLHHVTSFTGCDSTTATTCTVSINAARNVTATFDLNDPHTLTVAKNGTGTGNIAGASADGTRITCGTTCTNTFANGSVVTLTATPAAAGSRFTGWSGCDTPAGTTCTMSVTTVNRIVVATFTQGPDPAPPTAGTSPGSSPAPSLLSDTSAPGATGVGLTRSVFTVAGEATPKTGFASARRHKPGTTFNYTLSEKATVRIAIVQRSSGRRRGKSCVAPTRKLRKAARCTRITAKGTLTRTSDKGANAVFFTGRIGSKALSPGSYGATLTATDAASNTSRGQTMSFRIAGR